MSGNVDVDSASLTIGPSSVVDGKEPASGLMTPDPELAVHAVATMTSALPSNARDIPCLAISRVLAIDSTMTGLVLNVDRSLG